MADGPMVSAEQRVDLLGKGVIALGAAEQIVLSIIREREGAAWAGLPGRRRDGWCGWRLGGGRLFGQDGVHRRWIAVQIEPEAFDALWTEVGLLPRSVGGKFRQMDGCRPLAADLAVAVHGGMFALSRWRQAWRGERLRQFSVRGQQVWFPALLLILQALRQTELVLRLT